MAYFWLSFCDPNKPKGAQFLGVSIVEAEHYMLAVPAAWAAKCNPGGEVQITELPLNDLLQVDKVSLVAGNLNRLMDRDELERLGFQPGHESEDNS